MSVGFCRDHSRPVRKLIHWTAASSCFSWPGTQRPMLLHAQLPTACTCSAPDVLAAYAAGLHRSGGSASTTALLLLLSQQAGNGWHCITLHFIQHLCLLWAQLHTASQTWYGCQWRADLHGYEVCCVQDAAIYHPTSNGAVHIWCHVAYQAAARMHCVYVHCQPLALQQDVHHASSRFCSSTIRCCKCCTVCTATAEQHPMTERWGTFLCIKQCPAAHMPSTPDAFLVWRLHGAHSMHSTPSLMLVLYIGPTVPAQHARRAQHVQTHTHTPRRGLHHVVGPPTMMENLRYATCMTSSHQLLCSRSWGRKADGGNATA